MNEHSTALSRRAFICGTASLGIAAALTTVKPLQAFGVTAAQKQAEAAAALDSLNAMQNKLDLASDDYFTALEAQQAAQDKMDEAQARIDEANEKIAKLQEHLGTRARSMYRTGSFSVIDLLLGATSFQAFTTNWDILNGMNQSDADMVAETKALRAEVEEQKAVYAAEEAKAAEEAEKAAAVKAEAESLVAQMQATYDSLSAEAAELLRQEEAARDAARAAAAQAEIAAAAAADDGGGSSGGSSGGGYSGGGSSGGGSSVNNSKPASVSSDSVVGRAYSQLGKPYVWGATGPSSFDCSGLVSYCLSGAYGNRLGTTGTFSGWTRVTNPQPGDICLSSGHCGIYIGGGQMIHAPQSGDVVKVSGVQSGMYYVRY